MYKKINRHDMIENSKIYYRKCPYHSNSYYYISNMAKYAEIMKTYKDMDENKNINIKILFHILSAKYNNKNEKISNRINDIISSINDDFNGYTTNPNTMNILKYKNIVNNIFISSMQKQYIYLGKEYINSLPEKSANIIFELGEIYFYPIKSNLKLSKYNDVSDVEIEIQVIKKYIHDHAAYAINPENFLNIWIIDMDNSIMTFSNFPWEQQDNFHGIYLNIKCIFPEDYREQNFNLYKSITHAIGHYLGLVHLTDEESQFYNVKNLHISDSQNIFNNQIDQIIDPSDNKSNKKLLNDINFNPFFMDFMELTKDKFVTIFTKKQINKMHFMLKLYRSSLNHSNLIPNTPIIMPQKEIDNKIKLLSQNEEFKKHHHHRHHKHKHEKINKQQSAVYQDPIMYPDTRNLIPQNPSSYPQIDMNSCPYPNVDMNIQAMPDMQLKPYASNKDDAYFNPIEIYSNNKDNQKTEIIESNSVSRRFMRIKS